MNKLYLICSIALLIPVTTPLNAVQTANTSQSVECAIAAEHAREQFKALSRAEKKEKRKAIKTAIRDHRKSDTDTSTLLLVIVTILLPPLGMYLYEGEINNRFWISLLLTLLLYLPGLIYTLIIILGEK